MLYNVPGQDLREGNRRSSEAWVSICQLYCLWSQCVPSMSKYLAISLGTVSRRENVAILIVVIIKHCNYMGKIGNVNYCCCNALKLRVNTWQFWLVWLLSPVSMKRYLKIVIAVIIKPWKYKWVPEHFNYCVYKALNIWVSTWQF